MRINYVLTPRDVLFFRDARPMDSDKRRTGDLRLIGHGAQWPRPDLLFSAVIHTLVGDPERPDARLYGSAPDLRVRGPFPVRGGRLFLPRPLDWDMRLERLPPGATNLPEPLTHGFIDRQEGKKAWPEWIAAEDYARYLRGEIVEGKAPPSPSPPLWESEPRVGTTLDRATGTSWRGGGAMSGRWQMEVLRLAPGVGMLCEVAQARADTLDGRDVRFGGQGGTVRFRGVPAAEGLSARLGGLPLGEPTCLVRWTLLAPALFMKGWYPNWLNAEGRVMLPTEAVARRPGESRAAWRQRAHAETRPFASARLIAARIGKPVAFSGWDLREGPKPTELAVPPGSAYVFACDTPDEAGQLARALHLTVHSDLGEKGFGLGVCSYLHDRLD